MLTSSVTGDFNFRDRLNQTEVPSIDWHNPVYGRFGPCPLTYPKVNLGQKMTQRWLQNRVIAVTSKYIGLPYRHFHFPAMGGLDCSNFSSWIYNYGFGIRFSSNIKRQSVEAGRRLMPSEILQPGDLLFFFDTRRSEVVHVAIYVDQMHVIDSSDLNVQVRPIAGKYKSQFAWARRIFE